MSRRLPDQHLSPTSRSPRHPVRAARTGRGLTALMLGVTIVPGVEAAGPAVAGALPVPGAPTCQVLPADNVWNTPVNTLPVAPLSAQYIATIGADAPLHPDFGQGDWDGEPMGIPYNVVPGSQAKVPVSFGYAAQSDPGPYPVPAHPQIEGGPNSTGDRHVLVLDTGNCTDYEMWAAYPKNGGRSWRAGSGAVFHLSSNSLRPAGWTSADAAGLPILPGLVRPDEVKAGVIDHAIRVTVPETSEHYLWPARHEAGRAGADLPPMGLRLRLKASVDISGFPPMDRVILVALKKYGMIVADNGSPWFISGVPSNYWDNGTLHDLTRITGADFQVVDESCLEVSPNSGQADLAHCD